MKKLITIALALVMVLSLFAACGGDTTDPTNKPTDGATVGGTEDTTPKEPITLTIGLPLNANILDYKDNALTKWLEEQTGYNLEFQLYAGDTDIKTQISTTITAQEKLPDLLMMIDLGDALRNQYGRDGYFVKLNKYYEDRDGASKNFWDRVEAGYSEAEIQAIMVMLEDITDGSIYTVPTLETSMVDTMDYQMWINVEWLDKLGLEKPTTPDELYTVLKAFKERDPNGNGQADEIPLYGYGGSSRMLGADCVNWLMNMFVYLNDNRAYNLDKDHNVVAPFTSDEYREGLKFVNKLIKDGLMPDTVFNVKSSEIKLTSTPADGVALAGIFAGHLSLHVQTENEVLYQYEPLKPFGTCVQNDNKVWENSVITSDCENPDAAFNLLMTLFTQEGSYRCRYGEKGVGWDYADPGTKSAMGLDATHKVLHDPLIEQNKELWGGQTISTVLFYSEGEDAQITDGMSKWLITKAEMHAESRKLFDEAAAKFNPPADQIFPYITYTAEEDEEYKDMRTALASYWKTARTDFCTGKLDPNSDADWNAYLAELDKLGLEDCIELAQGAYERTLD